MAYKYKDLDAYQRSFKTAMEIFKISQSFPSEEKYSLTDQLRRSSRAVCSNLAEAWRRRKYRNDFLHKIGVATQEAAETQTWLEFAFSCSYIDRDTFNSLNET